MNVFFESQMDDDRRRSELYRGSVFLYAPSQGSVGFCEFTRKMVEAAFHPYDPRKVFESIPVERCVEVLAQLKPAFIHHPQSKQFIQEILADRGCDLSKTYFDVPRLRTAFPPEYLASGIAYAFHPHRDTWYSAPFSQINWWMPVYEICPDNGMAFHPRYWDTPLPNSSNTYNYYEWNRTSRKSASQQIKTDTRIQPQAQVAIDPESKLTLVPNPGGLMLFSGAQLHSTVQNLSGLVRYSIDFRTVHLDDVWKKCGAPNIDSACTGTTMRDYIRASDFTHLPDEAVALYFDGTEVDFIPSPTAAS